MESATRRRNQKVRKVEDDILGNECDDENKQTRTQHIMIPLHYFLHILDQRD